MSRLPAIVAERALLRVVGGLICIAVVWQSELVVSRARAWSYGNDVAAMGVFVVQVISSQEDRAAALIARLAQGAVDDCLVPKREVMHRKSGQWHRILEKLFPDYVFVQTSASNGFARCAAACPHSAARSHLQAIHACLSPPMKLPGSTSPQTWTRM